MTRICTCHLLTISSLSCLLSVASAARAAEEFHPLQAKYRLAIDVGQRTVVASTPAPAPDSIPWPTSQAAPAQARPAPAYEQPRDIIHAGATSNLLGCFFGDRSGTVMLRIQRLALECKVIAWRPRSVTIATPAMNLDEPLPATLTVILPDGRIAKTFRVLYASQPDIVEDLNTVPQPSPPTGSGRPAKYSRSDVVVEETAGSWSHD